MKINNIEELKTVLKNYYKDVCYAENCFKLYQQTVFYVNEEHNSQCDMWVKYLMMSNLYQSVMLISRLYDKQRDCFSLIKFQEYYYDNLCCTYLRDNTKFWEQIHKLKNDIDNNHDSIERFKKRRNKYNAHYDIAYLINENNVTKELPLYFEDKTNLIEIAKNRIIKIWESISTEKLTFDENVNFNKLKECLK